MRKKKQSTQVSTDDEPAITTRLMADTYIDGDEMKTALSGYLQVLFAQDPTSVGGAVPSDDFYK